MIMKREELALLKRGKRWFLLTKDPGWEPGRVVRLRENRHDQGLVVTVSAVKPARAGGVKVTFTPGDSRDVELYLAAGWPDYTTDPSLAMRGELAPFPETAQERKERATWQRLGM